MSELVARTGRQLQRYDDGCRLIAGCIPFKYRNAEYGGGSCEKIVEGLMINSTSGPGRLFPKGGWENDETAEEAAEREAMDEAGVRGDLVVKNNPSPSFISQSIQSFPGMLSFTLQDESSPEGLCRAVMYALHVKEELEFWPEKSQRERSWVSSHRMVQTHVDERGRPKRILKVELRVRCKDFSTSGERRL